MGRDSAGIFAEGSKMQNTIHNDLQILVQYIVQ